MKIDRSADEGQASLQRIADVYFNSLFGLLHRIADEGQESLQHIEDTELATIDIQCQDNEPQQFAKRERRPR